MAKPCLHCSIRNAIIEFAKQNTELSLEDIIRALTQMTGEYIARVEIEDRELFMFQVLTELPEAIMECLDEEEEDEIESDIQDGGVRH